MKIALLLEYFGKNLSGSQFQKDARTVQSLVEEALSIWFRSNKLIRLTLSSRTDSGVHALGQVAHFVCPDTDDAELLDEQALAWGLNGILPADISVRAVSVVPETFTLVIAPSKEIMSTAFSIDRSVHLYLRTRIISYAQSLTLKVCIKQLFVCPAAMILLLFVLVKQTTRAQFAG